MTKVVNERRQVDCVRHLRLSCQCVDRVREKQRLRGFGVEERVRAHRVAGCEETIASAIPEGKREDPGDAIEDAPAPPQVGVCEQLSIVHAGVHVECV